MPRKNAIHRTPRNRTGNLPVPPGKYCNGLKPDDNLCKLPAGYGTNHHGSGRCKHHGGSTMSGQAAAHKQVLQSYAGDNPDIDPTEALLAEVRRNASQVQWLEDKISVWTMDTTVEIPPSQAQWIVLYQTERKLLANVCKVAIDAGVAQRQIALAEQQGQMLALAINQILDALDLTFDQKQLVPEVVPTVLRAIAVRADQLPVTPVEKPPYKPRRREATNG